MPNDKFGMNKSFYPNRQEVHIAILMGCELRMFSEERLKHLLKAVKRGRKSSESQSV